MEKIHKIEEGLSIIWEEREKKVCNIEALRSTILDRLKEDVLSELEKEGYVTAGAGSVKFTEAGEVKARDIIRRQRLAERLLIDVLELGRTEMDSSACEFEHILSKEVVESICTLLGHPSECPHGLPIPPGDCCTKAKDSLGSLVVPLSKLKPGEIGKVVYILTRHHPQLHKLMSLGLVPATNISVHQISPAFVIQIDGTQLALEPDIANNIHVKRIAS